MRKDCVQALLPYRARPDENRRFENILKIFTIKQAFRINLLHTKLPCRCYSRSTLGLYLEKVYQGLKRVPLLPCTRSPSPISQTMGIHLSFRCFLYQIDILWSCIQPGNRISRKGPQISTLRTMLVLYEVAVHHPYKLFEFRRWRIIAVYATLYILGKTRARLSIVCLPEK